MHAYIPKDPWIRADIATPMDRPPEISNRADSNGSGSHPDHSRVDLTTTLYGELRQFAAACMAGQQDLQTLQATALVHEAWLRLGGDEQPEWTDRTHFFAAVAEAMRHILVDRARWRQRIRHGGGLQRVELETWNWEGSESAKSAAHDDALLLVHEALEKLSTGDPETVKLVKLRFFAGLTVREAAEAMVLSERTVRRRLAFARAWLGLEIRSGMVA